MNTVFKKSVSLGMLCLVIFLQVISPINQNVFENSGSELKNESFHQVYAAAGLNHSDFLIADKSDNISFRIEVDHTLFYILSAFALDGFHSFITSINYYLSESLNIKFNTTDIIFPFAYFW